MACVAGQLLAPAEDFGFQPSVVVVAVVAGGYFFFSSATPEILRTNKFTQGGNIVHAHLQLTQVIANTVYSHKTE